MIPYMKLQNLSASFLIFCTSVFAEDSSFYKRDPLFSKRPDPGESSQSIDRFGPVGLGIELIQPPFMMRIKNIEEGSPAAATGQLKTGQIIESMNGETLADIDPRIQLGNIITRAEATDGILKLMVSEKKSAKAEEVIVKIPALGPYSETWPVKCPKSEKIVRDYAAYLKKEGSDQGFGSLGMLFLLSTGDDADLDHVRKWAHSRPKTVPDGFHTWNAGYGNLALCEYYLRTGDQEVLPAIQAAVEYALRAENNGAWGNRGPITHLTYGGGSGHLNAGSVPLATFLVLAKECGAKMPDDQFLRVLRHFYRWAGRGNISYGNGKPEGGYVDNGKNGKLAYTMAAAASLTPKGEKSIYARARDTSANFSYYSTSFMLHGHTGGGIGEIWRSASMGLLNEKRPKQYRDFMDERRWHYELSRRHDGSFGILGGERYDDASWGAGYALTYTVPRKTLRLTGAPRSKFSKPYELPERLWGTAEDEDFLSIEPIAYPDGTKPDFSRETLRDSGALAYLKKFREDLTDEDLRRYMRHPELNTRTYTVKHIAQRDVPFVMEMLRSEDARLRRLGLLAVEEDPAKFLTAEVIGKITEMLRSPEEAWYVKEQAINALGKGSPDQIVAHIDAILPYFEHEEWWLQHSALNSVITVVADKRIYQKLFPAMGKMLESNHVYNATSALRWSKMPENLRQADPEVAALAKQEFRNAYLNYVEYDHAMPEVENKINPGMRDAIAEAMVNVPGGYEVLYQMAKQRSPAAALPYEQIFLQADSSKFSPELKARVAELIKTRLIPRYIAENRDLLLREKADEAIKSGFYYREPRVFGLVELYQRIGIKDYDWHDFGAASSEMQWHYHSFDPPEALAWDVEKPRYRKITLPEGMNDWFKPSFDPAMHGWKTGKQPFGATNGELVGATIDGSRTSTQPGKCPLDFCRHGQPMQTLWENEVLLLRGKFKFPEFKAGHRYRLLIGGMSHVGAGEGFEVYLNGKEFFKRDRGVGRREGSLPISMHIDQSWKPEFKNGEVDIAVKSFMGIHKGIKHRQLSVWIQEMKMPELTDEEIVMSAKVMPMLCTGWQSLQDPDDNDKDPEAGKYQWDGNFVDNPKVIGSWKTVGVVSSPEAFKPSDRPDTRGIRLKEMTFNPKGTTGELLWIHSGSTLMDLGSNQALQMQVKTIDGKDYLFIEQGGFNAKLGMDWKPNWEVMTRVD